MSKIMRFYTVAGKAFHFVFDKAKCDAGLAVFKFGNFRPATVYSFPFSGGIVGTDGATDRYCRVSMLS